MIFIALPAFNQTVTVPTLMSVCGLQKALLKRVIDCQLFSLSVPYLDLARNTLLTMWYDTTRFSHLLFVDADMGFRPKLVIDMLDFDQPVVGTIYPRRDGDGWVGSGLGERRGDFVAADGIGMGCVLIKREFVDVMLEMLPDIAVPLDPAETILASIEKAGGKRLIGAFDSIYRGRWIREDQAFCLRARECGVKIWAHAGEMVTHMGVREHKGRYIDTLGRTREKEFAG
jgi:hypothetical protein